MRVTHVALRYPPASGGVEDYVQNLVERLREGGEDATVETTFLRTHHPPTFLEPPPIDPPYVHRHPVRTLGPLAYPIPRSLSRTLGRVHAPALIHAHGFWYAPADIAARVARRRRMPFVFNPYYAPRTKPLWALYRMTVGKSTLAAADAVVVISPQEEAALRSDGMIPKRVELIPPGIDPAVFAVQRDTPFAKRGLVGKSVIFFSGRIARAKGLDLLLNALPHVLQKVPSAHLAIAGEDFGEQGSLVQLSEMLGVSHAITWLGKLSREELLAAYQHTQVFAFPSRYEAFGISVLEAQAAGCPVVAMDTASLPFLVQHEETGLLFRPEDTDHCAASLLRVLNDQSFAHRLAEQARVRAHRDFSWDRSITKLRSLYADLFHTPSNLPTYFTYLRK